MTGLRSRSHHDGVDDRSRTASYHQLNLNSGPASSRCPPSSNMKINGRVYSTLQLTKLLIETMPRESSPLSYQWSKFGTRYNNVFTGAAGVTALQQLFNLATREIAVVLGLELQRKHYYASLSTLTSSNGNSSQRDFVDSTKYCYILTPFRTPNVLNSFIAWPTTTTTTMPEELTDNNNEEEEEKEINPMDIVKNLKKLWSKLESKYINKNSGEIDYANIHTDELYWQFEHDVCELQCILLMNDTPVRKAYIINVYNLMIKYAFCKVGVPTSSSRGSFFSDVSVNLGGHILSFDDLEHGILRGNSKHPYKLTKQFADSDSIILSEGNNKAIDHRIHFTLNCGANSCPPIMQYTPEKLNEELHMAAVAFCGDDANVCINDETCEIWFSKLLYWYTDFASSKMELPAIIAQYLTLEKRNKMDKVLQSGKYSIHFLNYDWSTPYIINTRVFTKGDLLSMSFFSFFRSPPSIKYDKTTHKQL